MSVIDEFLDELAGAKFFFNWTWHLVFIKSGWLMAVEDEINFQCISNLGLFPLKLTMSISNLGLFSLGLPMLRPFSVPNEFHFYSLDEEVCTLFMDDILVYSATMDDHITHLTGVFQVLLQHQLLAKAFKCSFAHNNIEYLGHIISDNIRILLLTPKKTATMVNQPTPKSHTELRGFHGFTGYHRQFIQYHGIMAKPLTVLLQQKVFSQSDSTQATFDDMKLAMVSAPMLALPNFFDQFEIETYVCDSSVGIVLSQDGHPIAYFSKALGVANIKLSIYKRNSQLFLWLYASGGVIGIEGCSQLKLIIRVFATYKTKLLLPSSKRKQLPLSLFVQSSRLLVHHTVYCIKRSKLQDVGGKSCEANFSNTIYFRRPISSFCLRNQKCIFYLSIIISNNIIHLDNRINKILFFVSIPPTQVHFLSPPLLFSHSHHIIGPWRRKFRFLLSLHLK